ncbi:MAG: sigma-70 family RNA polymerase sigma factor [Proteobacteria bacterium]|nr:sigma-70 family RNA polymerase sigma factor [Pseudomonadota bacterium]
MKRPATASKEEWSDTEAVALAREGDHDAFRVLVERYGDRVYRLALRVLRDEEQARDAVQEAFLKVYGALRRFEGRSSFYTWLYRLVLNLCLDIKRRDRSDRHVEWDEERPPAFQPADVGAPQGPAGPGEALERTELRGRIAAAIETLPEDARQTLLLREVDGLSYAEIAETMGIPKGTVMSRLHYARRKLQAELQEAGVAPPASEERSRE